MNEPFRQPSLQLVILGGAILVGLAAIVCVTFIAVFASDTSSSGLVAAVLSTAFSLVAALLAAMASVNVQEIRGTIVTLEKNTNSIKDALVAATATAAHAEGMQQERDESRQRGENK